MDVLLLCYRGEPLREFPLRNRALEIGRGAGCDIVVHDVAVRERHCLIAARGGTVVVHELGTSRNRPPRTLPPGEELPVGRTHTLVRLPDSPTRPITIAGVTEALEGGHAPSGDISLVVGRGSDARRVALDRRPLSIGSGKGCDLKLRDRAVSAAHCRVEPSADGYFVRDLGSRNGTFVDGVPVTLARVEAGSTIRVGRTDVRLVPRGRSGDARGESMVAESPEMQEVLELVERYGRFPWPTLVTGESGSGKEGVARALHRRGLSPAGPFVAINAGGMPSTLIESELFGHEKGAFTGATATRRGVFEQADGGTLFLDEIGELPLELQARLLRVLETWEVRRVGGEQPIRVDVRLVCATHRDLPRMVEEGTFRQDLYYRIAQLGIHVPALRERPADVDALADHFLRQVTDQLGPRRFDPRAKSRLHLHDWPGNARELRIVIRRAAARSAGATITLEEVEDVLVSMGSVRTPSVDQLRVLLEDHDGNLAAAARAVGIPRSTLRDKLRKSARGSR